MTEKTFWFYISDDYRSGRNIYTFTNPHSKVTKKNKTPEEACDITFTLPKEGQRMYIVNDFPNYKPIWYKDMDDDDDAELLYIKIFSQIHDCMPFVVTGYNSAYKQNGHYPDVPDDIKNLPEIIDNELVKKISDLEDDGYYFLFMVDSNGDEIITQLLNPF